MESVKLTAEQIKSVKGMGFLHNRGTGKFSGRVITENGVLTAKQLAVLSEAADKFGNGTAAVTVRLTLELPGIAFNDIGAFSEFIGKHGMKTGGTGSRVRPVVACKGTTCVFGLCDTQALASDIHRRLYEGYYDVVLPHKFKIAVGGCPNNCAKPELNDIGIVGQRIVSRPDAAACRGCARCGLVDACPMDAARLVNGKFDIDYTKCNNCGRCVGKCSFKLAENSEDRFKLYVGGRWGKKIRIGTPLTRLFTKEEALDVVEKAILLFKSEGRLGERFGETVDRLGISAVEKALCSDELLKNKQSILGLEAVGGAQY